MLKYNLLTSEKILQGSVFTGKDKKSIENLRQSAKDIVVIGDSITEGFIAYGPLNEDTVYSKIGASLINSEDLFESAASKHPKKAFFAFGMNDMGNFNGDSQAYYDRYLSQIKLFKKISPNTSISLIKIVPPTQEALSSNKILNNYSSFNDEIDKIAQTKKVSVVEVSPLIKNYPYIHESDGIHLKPVFYPLLLDHMGIIELDK
ncbi:GDSL-type esterase/lipase family protein [Eubacteriales bacterium KG127]